MTILDTAHLSQHPVTRTVVLRATSPSGIVAAGTATLTALAPASGAAEAVAEYLEGLSRLLIRPLATGEPVEIDREGESVLVELVDR